MLGIAGNLLNRPALDHYAVLHNENIRAKMPQAAFAGLTAATSDPGRLVCRTFMDGKRQGCRASLDAVRCALHEHNAERHERHCGEED